MVSHCGFDLYSLNNVLIGHFYIFLGKMSIQVHCPFKNWVICILLLSCMNMLCILDIKPLLEGGRERGLPQMGQCEKFGIMTPNSITQNGSFLLLVIYTSHFVC